MHVIQRGNNRQATFFADEDCRFYLECLGDAAGRYACRIHACVFRPATCTCSPAPRRPVADDAARRPALRAVHQRHLPQERHF
jgi:hypothetical protein